MYMIVNKKKYAYLHCKLILTSRAPFSVATCDPSFDFCIRNTYRYVRLFRLHVSKSAVRSLATLRGELGSPVHTHKHIYR